MSLLHDWRNQISWGRVCALVALVVAVAGQFRGMDTAHLAMWLSVATGNYAASKYTEIKCSQTVALAGAAPGVGTPGSVAPRPAPAPDMATGECLDSASGLGVGGTE